MTDNQASADDLFLDAEHKEERGDFKGAFQSLRHAAELGHALSQIQLGNFYSAGR